VSRTRREALALGLATTLPFAGAARAARAQDGGSDVDALEELLVHEQGLASAYEAALRRGVIDMQLGETLLAHEREHVRGIEESLASRGRREPRATVPPPELGRALRDRADFLPHAFGLEAEAIDAYIHALPDLRDPGLRRPLGSIMVCGATHQIALREALGEILLPRPR
jgi:Ferritin-like domain